MVRAIVANDGSEVRQICAGYNNIFLGGNGRVILGEEQIEGVEGGRMYLPNDLWKTGVQKDIDTWITKNPTTDEHPGVLGLECFEHVDQQSNRIHHFN